MMKATTHQGEGERKATRVPLLFCVGQHAALEAKQRGLNRVKLLAFLDDLCLVSKPEREGTHCRIRVHGGKTHVWNQAGHKPEACDRLQEWLFRWTPQHVCGEVRSCP